MNPQNYTINIRPGWGISQVVKVSQGDVGRPLAFTIMDGQDAITLSSTATVTITGTKPSGLGFTQACTLSGNTASIDTVATMTQEAGSVPAELIVTDGSTVIGTANFVMYVEPAAHPEGTTDGDAETARDLMTRAQAAVTQAEAEADRAEGAAESIAQAGISTVGATAGQVPTANGAGGWSWQDQQGGGGTSDDIENKSSVSGTTVTNALSALSDEIASEATARTSAVSEVQRSVTEEASTRASADESLRAAIDALVSPSGQSVVVDSSLSISGAAADAKVTGNKVADLKSNYDENVAYSVPAINGWISNNRIIVTGENIGETESNNYYDCTDFIPIIPSLGNLSITAGETSWFSRINNAWYDKDKEFIRTLAYNSNTTSVLVPPSNAKYFRLSRGKEGTFTVSISISVPYDNMSVADWLFYVGKDDIRVYFAEGANPTISNLSYSSITVTLKNAKLIIYDNASGAKNFSASDILTAASAFGLTVDLEALTFTGKSYAFVYNYKTHSIYFRDPYAAISAFEINLLTRMYTSLISGKIYDIISNAQTDQNGKNIEELQSVVFPQVPSFFTSQLSTVIANVKNDLQTVGRHGDNFVFITDIHWNANFKRSPELIRKLSENKLVNLIVNGGDLIDGSTNKNEELERQTDCIDAFNKAGIPMITAVGNHDYNSGYGTSANYFDNEEYFATAQHPNALEGVLYGGDFYFYWDKVSTKTRYIVLDSGANNIGDGIKITAGQVSWIQTVIGNTQSDYHIVVVVHALGNYQSTTDPVGENNQFVYYTGVQDLLNALDVLLSDHMIEAVFFGHTHYDANYTTEGGIPLISTNSDARHQYYGMPNPSDGTVDSQCFDVVTIDYQADGNGKKHIYMRRVGRGSDRIIEY